MGRVVAAVTLLALASCSSPQTTPSLPVASGPPRVSIERVEAHARQFDIEMPVREPGSALETAAASYVLGHLQLAGYGTFLDGVPVADLVRSTNVVAFPPSGRDPETLVVVDYGTPTPEPRVESTIGPATEPSAGTRIGLFLELARALQVAEPGHAVGFVALGAATTDASGVSLGAKHLALFLQERGLEPTIVELADFVDNAPEEIARVLLERLTN